MAEYIEREAVLKLFDKVGCYLNPKCLERQKEDIEKIPTADVVLVVRCKDCKWLCKSNLLCTHKRNRVFNTGIKRDFNCYCNYGERRGNNA